MYLSPGYSEPLKIGLRYIIPSTFLGIRYILMVQKGVCLSILLGERYSLVPFLCRVSNAGTSDPVVPSVMNKVNCLSVETFSGCRSSRLLN